MQNLYAHPARDTPLLFRSNDNNMSITLPAPGLAYIAVPKSTSLTEYSPDPTVRLPVASSCAACGLAYAICCHAVLQFCGSQTAERHLLLPV